jgi:leader peptidase (prepilin peptidase)/N-methyltransferase
LPDTIFILFVFALGACVGSFLNVVVWRVPRGESIVSPPSRCPRCNTKLAWFDNVPVLGWIMLRGKCRYCSQPISIKYPIVEAIVGGLFVLYYVAMFIYQEGPCVYDPNRLMTMVDDWPIYSLYMLMISALLAASLIDAEHFIIPAEIPWLIAAVALAVHGLTDRPFQPGSLTLEAPIGAMTAGAGVGLLISIVLLRTGIMPMSFAEGAPLMEIEKKRLEEARAKGIPDAEIPPPDFTRAQLRAEMAKEMLFLLPPLILGGVLTLLYLKVPSVHQWWDRMISYHWLSGLLGSLWGAMIGAMTIWMTRILGTLAFGREAMGLGDVHLMFGIGAVIGAAGSVIIFFVAPFVGLLFALYKLLFGKGRELPYGPFLSLATAVVLLFYCRIVTHLAPSMEGLRLAIQQTFFGSGI